MGQRQHGQTVRRPNETLMWLEYPSKAVVVEISFQSYFLKKSYKFFQKTENLADCRMPGNA